MTNDSYPVQNLDVRELEPPEPMLRVLEALDQLRTGTRLRMLHRREPYPLYPILEQRGYQHRTTALADGNYEIMIWQ